MHNVICERLLTIWKAPFIDFYVKEALDATGHLRVLCLFVILWTTIYACEQTRIDMSPDRAILLLCFPMFLCSVYTTISSHAKAFSVFLTKYTQLLINDIAPKPIYYFYQLAHTNNYLFFGCMNIQNVDKSLSTVPCRLNRLFSTE